MTKTAKNGIYTTGKESFRLSELDDNGVNIYAIDTIDVNPTFSLKAGQSTRLSTVFVETLLNDELQHYHWSKE